MIKNGKTANSIMIITKCNVPHNNVMQNMSVYRVIIRRVLNNEKSFLGKWWKVTTITSNKRDVYCY